jgi:GDP/UDP-N,N'-diacetylbacillosamine 2-epimerase (hydrolysing)
VQLYSPDFQLSLQKVINPYGEGGASAKVVNILKHYFITDIVKKSFYDLHINSDSGSN